MNENISFTDYPSGIRLSHCSKWAINWKMAEQFSNMTSSSHFFDVVLFLLSSLVTGSSFMWIIVQSLVQELWQFSFIKDWSKIRKLKISQSELCQIFEDWGELGIPSLARMSLKCYLMLQNPSITAFTVSKLLRENKQGE